MDKTPMQKWLADEISAGKFCELVGVPRHVGEEQILHAVWLLREKNRMLENAVNKLRELLPLDPGQLACYVEFTFVPEAEAAMIGRETGICRECESWTEKSSENDIPVRGWCDMFKKITDYDHGDKCTAFQKYPMF